MLANSAITVATNIMVATTTSCSTLGSTQEKITSLSFFLYVILCYYSYVNNCLPVARCENFGCVRLRVVLLPWESNSATQALHVVRWLMWCYVLCLGVHLVALG